MKWGEADKFSSLKGATAQVRALFLWGALGDCRFGNTVETIGMLLQVAEETPVTNDSEWSDYVDEKGNVIEGTDDDPGM